MCFGVEHTKFSSTAGKGARPLKLPEPDITKPRGPVILVR
jgi:hypothetical protein